MYLILADNYYVPIQLMSLRILMIDCKLWSEVFPFNMFSIKKKNWLDLIESNLGCSWNL